MSVFNDGGKITKDKIAFVDKFKGYLDLTRAHFAIVWPLLFCAGAMLAFREYSEFSWLRIFHVAGIGFFGFEAGMVLNDILDRNIDNIEPDHTMTNYWRPFKKRPIPSGIISINEAIIVFCVFLGITITLIAFLPFPNLLYVYGIMLYAYLVESFYNIKKRNQKFLFAQLLGRTDLAIFPVAGFLCFGGLNLTIIGIIAFMYPWAIAHLAANDIIDIENDKAKNLKTITVLYGDNGSISWIFVMNILLAVTSVVFLILGQLGYIAIIGFSLGLLVVISANIFLKVKKTPKARLLALPMYHGSLFIFITSIIIDSVILPNSALIPF
jgi:4-hydroxybenzoate polyprenyltransferase